MKENLGAYGEEFDRILAKAERMLQAAEGLFRDGLVESAASRAYYSAFHAIQALLKSIDQTYSKHSGVIAAFHQLYTGIRSRSGERRYSERQRYVGLHSSISECWTEIDPMV